MNSTLSLRALLAWPLAIALAIAFAFAAAQPAHAQECPEEFGPLCDLDPRDPEEGEEPGEEEGDDPLDPGSEEEDPAEEDAPEDDFSTPQVEETPVGGVAAGPTTTPTNSSVPLLALFGVMIAAGVAGLTMRRRAASR